MRRSGLEAYGTLLLRIFLGFIYLAHAYLAVYKIGFPSGLIAYQRSVGMPLPELGAWYLLLAHGVGGILLILGILVRWAALANIPVMAGTSGSSTRVRASSSSRARTGTSTPSSFSARPWPRFS